MRIKAVYVKWADAHGSGGAWEPVENASAGRVYVHAVGLLWEQSETDISLVQNLAVNKDDEDAFYNRMDIPLGMVLEMRTIGEIDTDEAQGESNEQG